MPVKAISSTTAMPAPITMPHRRCRGARPRQAIAITSALSPDNSTLIQMILPTASQNAGVCRSAWNCVNNAPTLAGSKTCNSQFTARPLGPRRPCAASPQLIGAPKSASISRRFRCPRRTGRFRSPRSRRRPNHAPSSHRSTSHAACGWCRRPPWKDRSHPSRRDA